MRRNIGWLWVAGYFGVLAAANAQAPPPSTAGSSFDGTYQLVSSAKVNATYTSRGGQMGQCPDLTAGPLTIVQGQAQYTSATGNQLNGTVGSKGELAMRSVAPPSSGGGFRPVETNVNGTIDASGTVRARQIGNSCSYDFIWQKETR